MENVHLYLDNVCKIYKGGRSDGTTDVKALDGVSLSIPHGQFVAIMGQSGSGKSTLLHVAAGLTKASSGVVKIGESNLETLSDRQLTLFRRENVGVVFQAFNLIPTLTAEENILLPILAGGNRTLKTTRAQQDEAMTRILERLQLTSRRAHYPDARSGGEQQRAAIARALFVDFLKDDSRDSLLLADEPTGNLDSANSEIICKLLRELCNERKHTMLVVTHEPSVAKWADRVVVLKDGQILRDVPSAEFVKEG